MPWPRLFFADNQYRAYRIAKEGAEKGMGEDRRENVEMGKCEKCANVNLEV